MIIGLAMLGLSGCDTGQRNLSQGTTVVPVNCTGGVPVLLSGTFEACPGDSISLEVLNPGATVADNIPFFRATGANPIEIAGVTVDLIMLGNHPIFECPYGRIEVVVPTGARDGTIRLIVAAADGTQTDAGIVNYIGCPEIVGYVVGASGTFLLDAVGVQSPTTFFVYGYNFSSVTSATVTHPGPAGQPVVFAGLAATGAVIPGLAGGMDAVEVDIDPIAQAALIAPAFFYYLKLELVASGGATTQTSNAVEVAVRGVFGPGDNEDMPGTITGLILPTGIRSGIIEIKFNLTSMPANARYDLGPEVLGTRLVPRWTNSLGQSGPCTPIGESGLKMLSGVEEQQSAYPALIGGGASQVFRWDAAKDIFPATPGNAPQPEWVILTLRPGNDLPDVTTNASGEWETGRLVILNQDDDVPFGDGQLIETFGSKAFQDLTAPSTASWNESQPGNLVGSPIGGGVPPWGNGTDDVVLQSDHVYEFNTDSGDISDLTDLVPLFVSNPGSSIGEYHFRSFLMPAGLSTEGATPNLSFFGTRPFVLRISGDGNPDTLVCQINATMHFDGANGTPGVTATGAPGVGGLGGLGGGDGGDGGAVVIAGTSVMTNTPAGNGGNNGGFGGTNITFRLDSGTSGPKSGAGGGGGCATRGEDGFVNFAATTIQAPGAKGGPARGDSSIRTAIAGSGGGGGGGGAFRGSTTGMLINRGGGGGGGGGGAFELVARGSVAIGGEITVNGGNGGQGSAGTGGPAGGGSGGTIRVSATGDIAMSEDIVLEALPGIGFTDSPTYIGGDGALGRIRLEANGSINFPSQADFTDVQPAMGTPGVSSGQCSPLAIDAGTGVDGALNLAGLSGIVTIDTSTGRVLSPTGGLLLQNASGDGEFHLSTLNVPVGVTLRGFASDFVAANNPLILRVQDEATIAGIIDVSGFDGGVADVLTTPATPTGGLGGVGGPAGGRGGAGGFANSATDFADGGFGGLEILPAELVDLDPPFDAPGGGGLPIGFALAIPAIGGESVTTATTLHAGKGGGGGYAVVGRAGSSALASADDGAGGTVYGSLLFVSPLDGSPLQVGGGGGAGGGGNVNPAAGVLYSHAPGTGGGGGGGFLQVAVGERLTITAAAQLLARGGNAFRGPANGGNAGAGAGGGIHVQCGGFMLVEVGGPVVDVRGGDANRTDFPPGTGYVTSASPDSGTTTAAGDGGSGRIRFETPLGFVMAGDLAINPPPSLGNFRRGDMFESTARSLSYQVLAGGVARRSGALFDAPLIATAAPLPAGTDILLLLQGGPESEADPGRPADFVPAVDDVTLLNGAEFVRMTWFLYSNSTTFQVPIVDIVTVDFGY
ncbi:MAG: hypothetical protein ACKVX7_16540 [Planctomycetota bacterium]